MSTVCSSQYTQVVSSKGTSVEDPVNGPFSDNVLVVPNEIHLLPNIAKESADATLAKIGGAVEPSGAENADLQLGRAAGWGSRVEGVDEQGAIVPLEVVEDAIVELVPNDVEVATIRPVVPEVY